MTRLHLYQPAPPTDRPSSDEQVDCTDGLTEWPTGNRNQLTGSRSGSRPVFFSASLTCNPHPPTCVLSFLSSVRRPSPSQLPSSSSRLFPSVHILPFRSFLNFLCLPAIFSPCTIRLLLLCTSIHPLVLSRDALHPCACLLLLGISLSHLPRASRCVSHRRRFTYACLPAVPSYLERGVHNFMPTENSSPRLLDGKVRKGNAERKVFRG